MLLLIATALAKAPGDTIAEVAAEYLDEKPALRIEACNGLIEDVLLDALTKSYRSQKNDLFHESNDLHLKFPESGTSSASLGAQMSVEDCPDLFRPFVFLTFVRESSPYKLYVS